MSAAVFTDDPAFGGHGMDQANSVLREQALQFRPQGVEVARLNLDQQVIAHDVDDVTAELNLQRVARLGEVRLQRGMKRALA